MKKLLFIVGILIAFGQSGLDAQIRNGPIYKSWIYFNNGKIATEGLLYEVKDSSITLTNSMRLPKPLDYKVEHIELVEVRKDGSVTTGVLVGSLVGGAVGLVVGVVAMPKCDEDDWSCNLENAFTGPFIILGSGAGFGLAGGLIGAAISSPKISFPIGGKYEKYHDQKEKLREYSILK
jgi:hypothetical protein